MERVAPQVVQIFGFSVKDTVVSTWIMMLLVIGGVISAHLLEPRLLVKRIIDLGKGVTNFHPSNESFKTLYGVYIVGFTFSERGNIARVIINDRGLNQVRL